MKSVLSVCALISAVVAVNPAYATCSQANIAGGWRLYTQGHDGAAFFGLACTLIINAKGALSPSSACADTLGRSTPVIGSLKLASAQTCDYTGKIDLTTFSDINDIEQTTLSPDRNVLAGAGYDEPSTIGYAFTMIRIQ